MTLDALNLLRLEVQKDPDGLPNLIANPDGGSGAWGWITPNDGQTISVVPGGLQFRIGASAAAYFTSENATAVAGKWFSGRLDIVTLTAGHNVVLGVDWIGADGTAIGSATVPASAASSGTVFYGPAQAPADTAYARLRVTLRKGSGNPEAYAALTFTDAMLTYTDDGAPVSTRENLIYNGIPAATLTGWSAAAHGPNGGTGSLSRPADSTGPVGDHVVRVVAPPLAPAVVDYAQNGQNIPVTNRETYTLAVWVRSEDAERFMAATITWGNGDTLKGPKLQTSTTDWKGYLWSFSTVGRTQISKITFAFQGGDGEAHRFVGLMLVKGSTLGSYFDGDTTDTDATTYAWTGAAHGSTSTAISGGSTFDFAAPVEWLDILGETNTIQIDRDELDVGTLTGTVISADLDPSVADFIRPGHGLRLRVLVDEAWEPIFTGTLQRAQVTYQPLLRDAKKRATVTLTATDAMTRLAQAQRPDGVATIAELPYVLEGAGVAWSVNGSGNQVASADVIAYNDDATAADQVAITRDTVLGYAWVDRGNVLQAWDRDQIDTTIKATLDEDVYGTDVEIDFDTDRCINDVTFTRLLYNPATSATGSDTLGPYINQDSYAEWGDHAATYTVQGLTDAQVVALGTQILAQNAVPVRRILTAPVPILSEADLPLALLDLYDLVHVSNARANVAADQRIVGLSHTITASTTKGAKWTMTVNFAGDGSVAPAQNVPTPTGASLIDVGDAVEAGTHDPLADLINANSKSTIGAIPDSANVGDLAVIGSVAYVCTVAYTSGGTLEANWAQATMPTTIALIVATATAFGAAGTAQASADGKNTIAYVDAATLPPSSSTAGVLGDTIFGVSNNQITAQYKLTGISGSTYTWTSVQLASSVIANLDVGKITGAIADFIDLHTTLLTTVAISSSTITSTTISSPDETLVIDASSAYATIDLTAKQVGTSITYPQIGFFDLDGDQAMYVDATGIHAVAANGYNSLVVSPSLLVGDGLTVGGAFVHSDTAANGFRSQAILNTTTTATANVYVSSDGILAKGAASSRDLKHSIEPFEPDDDLAALERCGVFAFHYYDDPEQRLMVGVILEQMLEAGLRRYVDFDEDGRPYQPAWHQITALLIAAHQRTSRRLDALEAALTKETP